MAATTDGGVATRDGKWHRGIIRQCPGLTGLVSKKHRHASSSYSFKAGASPRIILQKTQSVSRLRCFSESEEESQREGESIAEEIFGVVWCSEEEVVIGRR